MRSGSGWRSAPPNSDGLIQALQVELAERQQAEEEKVRLSSKLRQAQKMEAIGTLAGGIAHDFNNILTPIIMFSEIAQRELQPEPPGPAIPGTGLKSSKRASDLVKQILSISRQTERGPVHGARPLVKESLKLLRASLPATIEIQQDLNPEEGWIMADPTQMYQVVMNLCTNAAHAMEETGGVLGVRLKNVALDQPVSAFGLDLNPGPYLAWRSGTAATASRRKSSSAFSSLTSPPRAWAKAPAWGLPWSTASPGPAAAASRWPANPTRAPLSRSSFPCCRAPTRLNPKKRMPCTPAAAGSWWWTMSRILWRPPDRLEKAGYQVETRSNGQEALEAFSADPDRFDLVFTDQTMPQLTGVELAQEVMKVRPRLPIIICTGFSESITPEQIRELGVAELLMKPLTPGALAEAVRRGLEAGRNQPGPGAA